MTNTTSDKPRISMCCKPDEQYPPESSCNQNRSIPFEETIFPEVYDSNLSVSTMIASDFAHEYGISCSGNTYDMEFYPTQNDTFYLMENGEIYVNESTIGGLDFWLGTNDYCFASRFDENTTKGVVTVCESLYDSYSDTIIDPLFYIVPLAASLPFLAATFVVYTILPELRNIHGFILRSYVACNVIAFTLFVIILSHARLICTYFLALTLQFTLLTSHFWMNVMGFDIWWTFRSFKSLHGNSGKSKRKRVIVYSIYAWGSGAFLTGISSTTIDFVRDVPTAAVQPGLPERCWFTGNVVDLIYLFGPMSFTVICNTCLFIMTAITIIRYEKNTAHHFRGNSNGRHNHEKQRFKLYLKLFIVMGVASIGDSICWYFEPFSMYVTYIIELPHRLQGFTIFIIFVWKGSIKRQLLKRLGLKNGRFWSRHSTETTTTTSRITLRECGKDIHAEQSKLNVDEINV